MKKQTTKSLYKKLLCFVTAFVMMAVILLPSVTVKASNDGYFFMENQRYNENYSFAYSNYTYDANTKTLTLKGGHYRCGTFLYNCVSGLTIYIEKDTMITNGEILLHKDTTITGPGKLTIINSSPVGIYALDGAKLTITNANIDINVENSYNLRGSWAICGNETREELVIRNSIIHAKANTAAISDFRWMNVSNCEIVSPKSVVKTSGGIYQSDGKTLAKEVKISNLYFVQQPESQINGAVGDTVTLKVAVVNSRDVSFQWQRYNREKSRWENVNYSGAQSRSMSFVVGENMYSWRFRCVVTRGSETLISNDVNLRVVARITSQPASTVYVNRDATVLLKVSAEGTISRYTWQYYNNNTGKWENLQAGTNFYNVNKKSMTVKGNDATNNMKFRCAVMNTFGYTTYTDETTLKVR